MFRVPRYDRGRGSAPILECKDAAPAGWERPRPRYRGRVLATSFVTYFIAGADCLGSCSVYEFSTTDYSRQLPRAREELGVKGVLALLLPVSVTSFGGRRPPPRAPPGFPACDAFRPVGAFGPPGLSGPRSGRASTQESGGPESSSKLRRF